MTSLVRDDHGLRLVLASSKEERDARPRPAASPELVARCRRGDRAALDEVFRAHAHGLERLLARLVGPNADLEDLLQETFAAAITAFPRFRGEASVKTWLHSIAVHVAHSHLRRPRRPSAELVEADHATIAPGPAEDAERQRVVARLYAHLDHLDAKKRVALVLHVVEDLSVAEVAAIMGASIPATKSRLFWARRALLRRLRRDPALAPEGDEP